MSPIRMKKPKRKFQLNGFEQKDIRAQQQATAAEEEYLEISSWKLTIAEAFLLVCFACCCCDDKQIKQNPNLKLLGNQVDDE